MSLDDRLEALRDKWSDYAYAIEQTHGPDYPAALAFRLCIGELYKAQNHDEEQ